MIKDNPPERVDVIPTLPNENRSRYVHKGFVPRPYQDEGIARGIELKRFINGDQPGLGTTNIGTLIGAEKGGSSFSMYCDLSFCFKRKLET
jgi:SWI/SNF-related matrix-associated actin-dependent regulator 1 of chromatin subfamily A